MIISSLTTTPLMVLKILMNSFCKIVKKPFYRTIFRKSKMDIYFCPFLKISVDFLRDFLREPSIIFSLKTIKIRTAFAFVEYIFILYKINNRQHL